MLIHYAGITCPMTGKIHNEDCLLMQGRRQQTSPEVTCGQVEVAVDDPVRFAIADGVGGMPAAARASHQLLDELARLDRQGYSRSPSRTAEKLRDRIVQLSTKDPSLEGAATTLVTAEIHHDHIRLWHAGDSRAYLWTEQALNQLTRDQTMLASMRERGELSETEAKHVAGSAIYGAVDECFVFAALSDIPAVVTQRLDPAPGTVLLLASDGLHRHLTQQEIHAGINPLDLAKSAQRFAEQCRERGGLDDVSLILLYVEQEVEVS